MTQQDSRILYFTRRPEIEARVKRLVQNPRQNSKVIKHLYEWVKSSIHESGIPFVELNDSHQCGTAFGEKLANGIQDLIDEGVENIIIIGNDSPDLAASDLTKTLDHLLGGSQVMGHSLSGGSWIIGIRAADFDKEKFENLPWQTTALGAGLKSLMESQGNVSFLKSRHDVNDAASFFDLLDSDTNTGFWRLMRAFLYINRPTLEDQSFDLQLLSVAQPALRAPPAFSSL